LVRMAQPEPDTVHDKSHNQAPAPEGFLEPGSPATSASRPTNWGRTRFIVIFCISCARKRMPCSPTPAGPVHQALRWPPRSISHAATP
jgi:hypothetical protein